LFAGDEFLFFYWLQVRSKWNTLRCNLYVLACFITVKWKKIFLGQTC